MYRYTAPNGGTVITSTLPADISQQGYDVLNGQTMRLIKRVDPAPTEEELAAIVAEKEAKLAAEAAQKQQAKEDAEFLETHYSEANFIKVRDYEFSKRDKELLAATDKQSQLLANQRDLQARAAEEELSGQPLSEQLEANLEIIANNIALNSQAIVEQEKEREARVIWHEENLERLKKLLSARAH
jgi:hypothetical protein